MRNHRATVLALSVCTAIVTGQQNSSAQDWAKKRIAQNTARPAAPAKMEDLPPGRLVPSKQPSRDASPVFGDDAMGGDHGFSEVPYADGACADGCSDGCCDYGSGGYSCGGPVNDGCCGLGLWGCGGGSGQWFFTADYLYVRASFSEATEFVRLSDQTNPITRDVQQLDFDFNSSYRFGGGYRLCGCGEEMRFLFTRLRSDASDNVPFDINVEFPFEPPAPPGGRTVVDADVDLRSYDLECTKTIPLGAGCCECGDACSDPCGGCCTPSCPVWDITWSGGLRGAEGGWSRTFTGLDESGALFSRGFSKMDFDGIGAKVGLEGRRYFGRTGWLNAYLKGDISLLFGDVKLETTHTDASDTGPAVITTQRAKFRQIIPVTELEGGLAGQITCHARLSAGYLLSAWHDLGMRDEFGPAQGLGGAVFPVHYDDANILGFDGYFARLEVTY